MNNQYDMIRRDQVEVFAGRVSPGLAYLYVRAPELGGGGAWTLAGHVRGPACLLSRTLPLEAPLEDLGAGPTLLARAIVPDPCSWSPLIPALYQLTIELMESGQLRQRTTLEFGFRYFGVSRRSLWLENRRWVLRGIAGEAPPLRDLPEWRDASAALMVRDPTEDLCLEAGRQGVLLVAQLAAGGQSLAGCVRRLAQHPAVLAALLPENTTADKTLRGASGNMLLGQYFRAGAAIRPAAWADLAVCQLATVASFRTATADCELPVVASRRLPERLALPAARAACDQLQQDLAPCGDFAGYLVELPSADTTSGNGARQRPPSNGERRPP